MPGFRAAGARVDRSGYPVLRPFGDLAPTATAGVALARGRQLFKRGLVGGAPVTLVEHRPVPGKTVVFERGEDGVGGPGHFAGRVDVLDPDQPVATLPSYLQVTRYG